MSSNDDELIDLKNKINSQLEDIKNNTDEETIEKLENLHEFLEKKNKLLNKGNSHDKELKRLNKYNKKLSYYQRFIHALQKSVDIDPSRLMGLTDGIFGMVMTLLVFGMALPEMQLLTEGDFLAFIQSSIPSIGVTLVSFILIASFWIYHHEFIKINGLDIPYLWFNILFLACISFIPFTTSIIGSYSQFFIANVLFGLNIFLTLLCFTLMFYYADKRGFLETEISKEEKNYTYNTFYIIMGLTVIVNLLDFNISNNFIYLFFLVPIISTIRDIMFKMKHNI